MDLEHLVAVPAEQLRPLRRSEYDQLVGLHAFDEEKVELLYGMLVAVSPQGTGHAWAVQELTRLLILALGDRASVRCQLPLAASDESEPEPDLAVVPRARYLDDHPSAAHLVAEVADTSLHKDRVLKGPLYAEMGVPEYWIINVAEKLVEVHTEIVGHRYARVTPCGGDSRIELVAFPDVAVRVADLF